MSRNRHVLIKVLQRPIMTLACAAPSLALAAPTGGDVVAGSASISNPSSNTTQIDQSTNRAIINFQTFSVGADEFVRFNQPGTNAVTLNRVIGGDPSSILGNISANGQIFLINPHGVIFGEGSVLDVQGLVASTLDISNDDFMAGRYEFFRSPEALADSSVINNGVIRARENGYVVLAGDYVENTGIMQAQLGTVVLASGNQVTLDIEGDGLVSYAINEATVSELAGVSNSGELYADGGRVILTAKVANDLAASAVNNAGVIRAQTIHEQDGEIFLLGNGASASNTGTIDASDSSNQDAGFVEISSDTGLNVAGNVNIGRGGELLIDPISVTIAVEGAPNSNSSNVGIGFIQNQLNNNTPVTIQARDDLSISASSGGNINASGSGSLTLEILANGVIGNDQTVGDGTGSINLNGFGINIAGNLTMTAGSISGDITGVGSLSANDVNLNGAGMLTGRPPLTGASSNSISITAANNLNQNIAINHQPDVQGAIVSLNASNTINSNRSISVSASSNARINLNGGDVNLVGSNNTVVSGNGTAVLRATGNNVNLNNATVNGLAARLIAGSSAGIINGGQPLANNPVGSVSANNISLNATGTSASSGTAFDARFRLIATGDVVASNLSANATQSTARGRLVSQTGNVTVTTGQGGNGLSLSGQQDARFRAVGFNAVDLNTVNVDAANGIARLRVENLAGAGSNNGVKLNNISVTSSNQDARLFVGSDGNQLPPADRPLVFGLDDLGFQFTGPVSATNVSLSGTAAQTRVFSASGIDFNNFSQTGTTAAALSRLVSASGGIFADTVNFNSQFNTRLVTAAPGNITLSNVNLAGGSGSNGGDTVLRVTPLTDANTTSTVTLDSVSLSNATTFSQILVGSDGTTPPVSPIGLASDARTATTTLSNNISVSGTTDAFIRLNTEGRTNLNSGAVTVNALAGAADVIIESGFTITQDALNSISVNAGGGTSDDAIVTVLTERGNIAMNGSVSISGAGSNGMTLFNATNIADATQGDVGRVTVSNVSQTGGGNDVLMTLDGTARVSILGDTVLDASAGGDAIFTATGARFNLDNPNTLTVTAGRNTMLGSGGVVLDADDAVVSITSPGQVNIDGTTNISGAGSAGITLLSVDAGSDRILFRNATLTGNGNDVDLILTAGDTFLRGNVLLDSSLGGNANFTIFSSERIQQSNGADVTLNAGMIGNADVMLSASENTPLANTNSISSRGAFNLTGIDTTLTFTAPGATNAIVFDDINMNATNNASLQLIGGNVGVIDNPDLPNAIIIDAGNNLDVAITGASVRAEDIEVSNGGVGTTSINLSASSDNVQINDLLVNAGFGSQGLTSVNFLAFNDVQQTGVTLINARDLNANINAMNGQVALNDVFNADADLSASINISAATNITASGLALSASSFGSLNVVAGGAVNAGFVQVGGFGNSVQNVFLRGNSLNVGSTLVQGGASGNASVVFSGTSINAGTVTVIGGNSASFTVDNNQGSAGTLSFGDIDVSSNTLDADVNILVTNGDLSLSIVNVTTNLTNNSADITLNVLNGNLAAGGLFADGGSLGRVAANVNGNATIGSVFAATGASGGRASVDIRSNTADLTITAPITAQTFNNGRDTLVFLGAAGSLNVMGNVTATGGSVSNLIDIGSTQLAGPQLVSGGGLLTANQVDISLGTSSSVGNTGLINTNAQLVNIIGNPGDVTINNTAFTGDATLSLTGVLSNSLNTLDAGFGGNGFVATRFSPTNVNGLALTAVGNLSIGGTDGGFGFNVGPGAAPGEAGDASLLNLVSTNNLGDGGGFTTPNAVYRSGGVLNVEVSAQTDGNRYLVFEADSINFSGTTAAPGLLVEINPFTSGTDVVLSSTGTSNLAGAQYSASAITAAFTGTTIGFGDAGNVTVAEPVQFGDKNVLVLAAANVTGGENIITTGFSNAVPVMAPAPAPTPDPVPVDPVPEPEPEPIVMDSVPEPEPEPIVMDPVPEPEPEPIVMEPVPEPEPEPIVMEPVPEPEPEPIVMEPEEPVTVVEADDAPVVTEPSGGVSSATTTQVAESHGSSSTTTQDTDQSAASSDTKSSESEQETTQKSETTESAASDTEEKQEEDKEEAVAEIETREVLSDGLIELVNDGNNAGDKGSLSCS